MDYFKIPASELGKDAKIPVYPLGDSGEVFYELALEMVNTIKEHNAAGKKTVFICPVGKDADFAVLSPELDVLATCSAGKFVYAADKE